MFLYIYLKLFPIGGKLVDPELPIAVVDIDDFKVIPIFEALLLLLLLKVHFCNKPVPIFGN